MTSKAQQAWDTLNERQRTYLQILFEEDQEREAIYRKLVAQNWDERRPARQWRRMDFNYDMFGGVAMVAAKLKRAGVYDSGAGSTLRVLVDRGLIELEGGKATTRQDDPTVWVWMTAAGRRAAKVGLKVPAPVKHPKGHLKEWAWRELVKVASAEPDGVDDLDLWHAAPKFLAGDPDGAGLERRGRGLIEMTQHHAGPPTYRSWWRWHLTARGRALYLERLAEYRELYSEIDAPDLPAESPAATA